MNCMILLLQIVDSELINVVSDVIDTTMSVSNIATQSGGNIASLITLLIINIVLMAVNFIFDFIKHRKDNHNFKVHLIAKKGVKVEATVFEKFQKLSTFQPNEEHALLDSILELDSFLNENRLYIEKKYFSIAIDFLDYYKKIQYKMTLKDIKEEESFFNKLSAKFYGE